MFGLGPVELAICGGVLFLIFGGGIMKRFAKGIKESKAVLKDLDLKDETPKLP